MVQSDRPEDETPPPSVKRRRRRPPVLELEATEVGATEKTAERKSKAAKGSTGPNPDTAASAGSTWHQWREKAVSGNVLLALGAGAVGAIAGAALVYLLASLPAPQASEPRFNVLAEQMSDMTAKIESLAARPPAAATDQSRLVDRIEKLAVVIGEAEQRLAAVEKRPLPQTPDLSAVNERTAAIESALKELRGALTDLRRAADATPAAATPAAVENVAKRIGGLEERIASLTAARAAEPAEASALAAEVVALNALAGAVQSGKPFVGELAAARTRLGDRAAGLAPLEPLAAKGAPTAAALSERFSLIAPDLLRAPSTDDGFLSRLMSNATRLVEVRRVGEPEGTSVSAIVARIEAKLARGDVAGALADADMLPDSAKATAAEWLSLARQRRDAVLIVQKQIGLTLAGSAEKTKP